METISNCSPPLLDTMPFLWISALVCLSISGFPYTSFSRELCWFDVSIRNGELSAPAFHSSFSLWSDFTFRLFWLLSGTLSFDGWLGVARKPRMALWSSPVETACLLCFPLTLSDCTGFRLPTAMRFRARHSRRWRWFVALPREFRNPLGCRGEELFFGVEWGSNYSRVSSVIVRMGVLCTVLEHFRSGICFWVRIFELWMKHRRCPTKNNDEITWE